MNDIKVIDMEDTRLYQHTIWLKDEDYRRVIRLADRLDISKSEVIMDALKLYEDGLNAVEAHADEIDKGFRRASAASLGLISDFEKLNRSLAKFGGDVSEPIDPERLRELLEAVPEEFVFEPKK